MEIKAPRIRKCALIFAIIFACQYGIEHAAYMLTDAVYAGDVYMTAPALSAMLTTVGYVIEAFEIITLAAAVTLVLLTLISKGTAAALALVGAILGTKLIYVVPHYYMTIISYGYDSAESILFSFVTSLGILLIMLAELSAAIALGSIPAISEARKTEASWRDVLCDGLSVHELLDVKNRGTAALLIAAAVTVLKAFITAVIGAISMIVKYGASLSAAHIFGMTFDLIYPIALAVISYVLMHVIKDKMLAPVIEVEGEDESLGDKTVD